MTDGNKWFFRFMVLLNVILYVLMLIAQFRFLEFYGFAWVDPFQLKLFIPRGCGSVRPNFPSIFFLIAMIANLWALRKALKTKTLIRELKK